MGQLEQAERSSFASQLKLDYVRPALEIGNAYFNDRPILTIFLAILFAFSVPPVLAIFGTALFTIVTITLIALAVAFIASSAAVLGFSVILAPILLGALFASALLISVAIFAYLFFRLFVLVRKDGVPGVSGWACEMKSHVLNITNQCHNSAYSYRTDKRSNTSESVHAPETHSSDENDDGVKV